MHPLLSMVSTDIEVSSLIVVLGWKGYGYLLMNAVLADKLLSCITNSQRVVMGGNGLRFA